MNAKINGCTYSCSRKGYKYYCKKKDDSCRGKPALTLSSFSMYCKGPMTLNPKVSHVAIPPFLKGGGGISIPLTGGGLSGVRECVRKEKNPQGRTVCREWTKDYKLVSPKSMVCTLPGERPPAAAPTAEITRTALSEDEAYVWEILGREGKEEKLQFKKIAQETNIPLDRAKYALTMLELKGLATQISDEVYAMKSETLEPYQTGLIHSYSHPSGGVDFPAAYQIIEVNEIMPSHHPLLNFKWSPGYPGGIQDRDYSNPNLPYQAKVLEKAAKLDPSRVISTAKTAVEGPPIVVGDNNIVLSGNSRALSIMLASTKHPARYKDYVNYLINHATTFGLSPANVSKMEQPILVRRVAIPPSQYKIFASLANESPAMTLDIIGTMQSVAKYIPDDLVMTMDIDDEETLREYIASSRGQRFARAIMSALPPTKVGAYVDRQMLTEEGKALIEGVLFFKLIPKMEIIEHTPKILKNTLSFSIPEFFRIKIGTKSGQMPRDWDITADLPEAVEFFNRNLSEAPLSFWLRQESLFEREKKDVFDEDTFWGQLVVLSDKFGTSPRKFRDVLRAYASEAEQLLVPPKGGPLGVLKRLIGGIGNGKGKLSGLTRVRLSGLGLDIFEVLSEGRAPSRKLKRRR